MMRTRWSLGVCLSLSPASDKLVRMASWSDVFAFLLAGGEKVSGTVGFLHLH